MSEDTSYLQYQKDYYKSHKDAMLKYFAEPVWCEACQKHVRRSSKTAHNCSQRHQRNQQKMEQSTKMVKADDVMPLIQKLQAEVNALKSGA